MRKSVVLCGLWMAAAAAAQAQDFSYCYEKAYPESVKRVDVNKISVNGKILTIGRNGSNDFDELFENAGLIDQISQPYSADFVVPGVNQDPGRIRDERFFDALYGASREEVYQHLTKVKWAPSGETISFSALNGADSALAAVGRELDARADLRKYVSRTAGSFNYRKIAGEDRKSAHSYGAAIDFTLPNGLGKYWKWDHCTKGKTCHYPAAVMNDKVFQEVVSIFEKHHFVWGGKWYHYDTVHFEYRPELFDKECVFE